MKILIDNAKLLDGDDLDIGPGDGGFTILINIGEYMNERLKIVLPYEQAEMIQSLFDYAIEGAKTLRIGGVEN